MNYDPVNGASCQYLVGCDGSMSQIADEEDRSWCSSSRSNDHRAITIEIASDKTYPYAITDEAYNAFLDLATDICKRNGKKKLLWFGDKNKTLDYEPAPDEMKITVHRWFANKECPGDYIYNRLGAVAEEVTRRLNEEEEDTVVRYKYLDDIENPYYKPIVETLMKAGIVGGYGIDETGKNVIDLSEDMVRTMVFNYRGGAYDKKLIAAGFDPAVQ